MDGMSYTHILLEKHWAISGGGGGGYMVVFMFLLSNAFKLPGIVLRHVLNVSRLKMRGLVPFP